MTDTERRLIALEKTVFGNGQAGLKERVVRIEAEHDLRACKSGECTMRTQTQELQTQGGDTLKLSGDNLRNAILIILALASIASPWIKDLMTK